MKQTRKGPVREDSPEFYKKRMIQLINQAKKNGIRIDYRLTESERGKDMRVVFHGDQEAATVTVVRKGKR